MTRRELTQAVFRAARIYEAARSGPQFFIVSKGEAVAASIRALDACTEPDLDALDAAVAQAVEEWWMEDAKPRMQGERWARLIAARNGRYDALKPRARYEACSEKNVVVWDRQTREYLNPLQVAALLNERKP
jgi:hypothetical protein